MKIKKFSYTNHTTGWRLGDVTLGNLTLLVGASGVGKTQILNALFSLKKIAAGVSLNGREWMVEFEEGGISYVWSGRFDVSMDAENLLLLFGKSEVAIVSERLVANGDNEIFSRDESQLLYHGNPTVKLDPSKSAVELLKEEPDVACVSLAFKKMQWLDVDEGRAFSIPLGLFTGEKQFKEGAHVTIKDIKALKFRTPLQRLFLIKKHDWATFERIKESFHEIFTLIEDIDFDYRQLGDNDVIPIMKIKEKDVDAWISQPDISSGMCRTLNQIIALTLAEDGDIIMIDEFENGLGVNCIDMLADMALEPDVNVQVVMTSHHPYIINTIPFKDWRIVSRRGSEVKVNTASDLNIGEHSRHDAFMQLIQTSAYRTGQS